MKDLIIHTTGKDASNSYIYLHNNDNNKWEKVGLVQKYHISICADKIMPNISFDLAGLTTKEIEEPNLERDAVLILPNFIGSHVLYNDIIFKLDNKKITGLYLVNFGANVDGGSFVFIKSTFIDNEDCIKYSQQSLRNEWFSYYCEKPREVPVEVG